MTDLIYGIKAEISSLRQFLRDIALFCLPKDWYSNRYWRPFLLRLFGMKCASGVSISRCTIVGDARNIRVGENSIINEQVFFHAGGCITIGKDVGVGFQASFVTGYHEIGNANCRLGTLVRKDIVIEDGVWIATRAFIGPGVTIGAGSVVAAGAIVLSSMPQNVLIGGVPAKVIREIED